MKLARVLFPGIDDVFQGRYRIISEIGAGGFGTVYKAVQLATGQQVAIKVLRLLGARDEKALEKRLARLEREMRLCAQLHHPNIVGLIDFGRADDGSVYSIFEFVPGKNLEEVLAEEGALDPVEARHLMLQVLDALACAHGQGVIHRDLKPSNLMVISTGARRNALVLDFGIGVVTDNMPGTDHARLTATNEVLGTIAYASPEQLFSKPTSPASDLYSWGLVFLECLTGSPVIQGSSMMDALLKQVTATEVAMPPALHTHALGRLLRQVVAKRVEDRPATVQEVMKRLEACLVADLRKQDLAMVPAVPRPADLASQPPPAASEMMRVEPQPPLKLAAARPVHDVPVTLEAQAPNAYPLAGERRQVTAVCVMLSVAPGEGRVIDIEEADQLLYAGQDACVRVAARFRGHPTGAMGNQTIFWFGFPAADEDDARRAGRAALEMISEIERGPASALAAEKPALEIRIGIHTGIVVSWPSSTPAAQRLLASFGTTSCVASQLCTVATEGAIVVSGATHRLLRQRFSFSALGTHTLSVHVLGGAAARVETYRLEWPISITHMVGTEHGDGPMTNRAHEMELLLQRWDDVRGGRGQAVLVTGETGIGKSRLLRELASRIREVPHRWLECRSAPEDQNNALHPVIEMLERTLELGDDETPAGKLTKLQSLLQSLDFTLDEHMPLFSQLLGIPLNGHGKKSGQTKQEMAPHLFKEQLLNALVSLFFELAEREPLVLIAEDLQWSDPTTLELYSTIVQEASSARILLIFSARPTFASPWKSSDVLQLQLSRLGREEVKEMVTALSGIAAPPSSGLIHEIVERTDGVPLFVEELTRMMAESGLFSGSDQARPSIRPSLSAAVPGTLRDLLTARLDRLGRARGTAQIAAALGREFSFDLLAAVSPLGDPKLLQEDLNTLVAADLVHRKRRAKGQSYAFKHGLIRDTAYESMLKRARRQVHADIAHMLSERFADTPAARPDLLAGHLAEAGREAEAVALIVKAADTSLQRSAPVEAMGHAQQALAWLEALAAGPARDGLELRIQNVFITALITLKGAGSADVKTAITRAQALLENVEGSPFTALMMLRLGFYYHMRASFAESTTIWRQCLDLAERSGDTSAQVSALALLTLDLLYNARYEEAQSIGLRALALYDPEQHGHYAMILSGSDYRAGCYGVLSFGLWFLGFPDRALEQAKRGLALMEQLGHANSIAISLLYLASIHRYRRDPAALGETCARLQEISQRHGLFLGATAALFLGTLTGDADGPKLILGGIRAYGQEFGMPYWYSTIAETDAAAGRIDAALERIDECIRTSEATGEVHYLPELLRLKGTFLVQQDSAAVDGPEACFRRALELAHSQKSRMCELRAATSLASLVRSSDRAGEARSSLRTALAAITEGQGLPDIEEARALLAELGG